MMILLVIATVFCALMAVQSTRLLIATLWLAAVSALVALMLYQIGAWEFAVIELSVGAGLVTVLIVFAITMVGDKRETVTQSPRNFLIFAIAPVAILMAVLLPFIEAIPNDEPTSVTVMLWEQRSLDVIAQIVLIFAGILGTLGLLSERKASAMSDNTQQSQVDVPPAIAPSTGTEEQDNQEAA